MRNIIWIFIAVVFLTACTSTPQAPTITLDPKRVLILAPQGVDPNKDTVGFNALVRNVTQAFSADFSKQLSQRGFQTINVLDQQPTLKMGQKMALYSVKNLAQKVAVATIETKTVGTDEQIQLRVQFVEEEPLSSNTNPQGVRVRTTIEKSYFLRGSQSGDSSLSMSDIAKDFTNFIQNSGRLVN